ncbi:MAG: S46 family peptidase, partial [Planctomycetota bacterium]
ARIAQDGLFGIQNARKARTGMIQGLQDPEIMAAKEASEKAMLEKIKSDPELEKYADAWDKIAEVQNRQAERQGKGLSMNTRLFGIAQRLVQMAAEDQKPSSERLAEFADAGRASLEQQLFSSAPIYPELEQLLIGDLLARTLELRGADDPSCIAMLAGKNPLDRAAELVNGTKLIDVEERKRLAEGGMDAIENSTDTMIQFAMLVDDEVRATRKESEELQEIERQAYAEIAEAMFATQGTSTYPDATFSLRLAFGPVKGYELGGEQIPASTKMIGAFDHEQKHDGQKDYVLPESWHAAREKISGDTPFNFVCTADIIGGNSGSPVVNKDLELVGLIFDGNIQSLTADYLYDDRVARAVSVHSSAIRDALRYVYDAEVIADQLGK